MHWDNKAKYDEVQITQCPALSWLLVRAEEASMSALDRGVEEPWNADTAPVERRARNEKPHDHQKHGRAPAEEDHPHAHERHTVRSLLRTSLMYE